MPKTVRVGVILNTTIMKKIAFLIIALQSLLLAFAQPQNAKPFSGLYTYLHGGYDALPFYNNNTPYIDYKGGLYAGASVNYYWKWIGLGADFDFIKNQPKNMYEADAAIYPTLNLTENKITRMFYGIGPSFKYQSSQKFTAEFLLRGGLSSVKGGLTSLESTSPVQLLNFHAGYDAKSIVAAKAQAQFSYYFSKSLGVHLGAYYLRHFNTPELINPGYGFSAAYLPPSVTKGSPQPSLVMRKAPCNCDISSIGAFAGVSFHINKTDKPQKNENLTYTLAVTAKDKYTREALPNTDVVIKNAYGEIVNSGSTNNYGIVVFNNMKPGNYTIAGKLLEVDLEGAVAVQTEFIPNATVQKEILYTDERFILKGEVVECNAAAALAGASVVLTNTSIAEQKTTNTNDKGAFIFHALQNATYAVYARKNNYFSQTETIATKNFDRNKTLFVKLEVCMEKTDCGKAITLKNIHYDLDKYFIREDAKPELNKLAQFMKDNPAFKVELSSHTDSRASDSYNMTLSQNRANAAVEYLVQQGIAKSRLIPIGYGERRLLNRCKDGVDCSEAEHQLNRRTEMKVVCPDSQ